MYLYIKDKIIEPKSITITFNHTAVTSYTILITTYVVEYENFEICLGSR